jgi:hypothetical protein
MAIYPTQSNYVIDVDIITTTSFKAGMVLMRDDNGRAIPADNATLLYLPLQRKAGKHLGFAASDHDISGVTIVEPDVISTNWLDNNKNFQRYENAETTHIRRYIQEHSDPAFDISNPSNRTTIGKRGIGVYNQSGEVYITDQFKPVLHGDFGQDYTTIQTINPGDLLTVGSGINAGKMVKVNVNSLGTDIIVVGVVDKYDVNSGLLHFTNAFYSVTFSSSSAVLALDAGNSLSFPNTGYIGTVCGFAAEGYLTLTAPVGHVFDKVLFASYGTPNGVCGSFTIGSCHATSSQSAVEGVLLGNNSATFSGPALLGDPCMGVIKRFYIQARFAPIQAKDLTVNNNNGTITNGASYSTDGGGSWSFDGTNDYITMPMTSALNTTSTTWSVWYKSSSDTAQALMGKMAGSAFMLTVGPATLTLANELITIIGEDNGNRIGYETTNRNLLFNNSWHHIVMTAQPSAYNIYLDGVNLPLTVGGGSNNGNTVNAATSFIIGAFHAPGLYINGNMTDIRVYNRALSASEILAYYNTTKSRYGL